ncbi:MAG: hypothetical protein HC923_00545 [Myxococcales bacterium]|nr:hypothetical protein [Myxococcales bacterium]
MTNPRPTWTSTSHVHVTPLWMNLTIFGLLMVLTGLTVWTAYLDLAPFDMLVALSIAVVKATLVVLFFMHVKYSSKLVMLVAATGFVFLVFMFAFPLSDVRTRDLPEAWPMTPVDVRSPLAPQAPGTTTRGRGSPANGSGSTGPGGV